MLLTTGVVTAALGTAKITGKVVSGQDPSITDAFLLAAGLSTVAAGSASEVIPSLLSNLDHQPLGHPTETVISNSEIVFGAEGSIPSRPSLDWSAVSHANADNIQTVPVELTLDDQLVGDVIKKLTPSISDQLAAGEDVVILGSKVIDVSQQIIDDKTVTSMVVRQQVADAGELRLENIMTLIAGLNRGENIYISDVFVAVISDLFENPVDVLKQLFKPGQIYAAMRGVRIVEVDIISTAVTRQDSAYLGSLTESVDIQRKTHEASLDIQAERTLSAEQSVESTLELCQVHYRWSDVDFQKYNPQTTNVALVAGSATDAHLTEDISTTTTRTLHTTGRVNANRDDPSEIASESSHYQTIEVKRNVYRADSDLLAAIADGQLSDEEAASISLSQEESGILHEDERQWLGESAEQATPALALMLRQMNAGQTVSLDDGYRISTDIIASKQAAGQLELNQTSAFHASHEESAVLFTDAKTSSSRIENVDWGMDRKIVTEDVTSLERSNISTITGDQVMLTRKYNAEGLFADGSSLPAAKTESLSFIVVDESHKALQKTVKQTTISKTVFGRDTGKVLGRDVATDVTRNQETINLARKIYRVENADISDAIADGRLSAIEVSSLKAVLMQQETGETRVREYVDDSTASRSFESGWIDWAPLGSVASAGMKSSFGYELTAGDYFWAVADSALTVGTAGMGAVALKSGVMTAGKQVAKGQIRKAGQTVAKTGKSVVGEIGKSFKDEITAPFSAVKDATNYIGKHGFAESGRELGRQAVARGKMTINVVTGKNRFDLDSMIRRGDQSHGTGIGARKTINSKYAGNTMPASEFKDQALRNRYPNGVKFTPDGYPDFSPHAKSNVRVDNLTGNNAADFAKANQAAGYSKTPDGFTWHHHQNGKDMILVPTDLHNAVRHSGGASLLRQQAQIVKDTSVAGFKAGTTLNVANSASKIGRDTLSD